MVDKYEAIMLFGPPGSGKGTQGEFLDSYKNFHHIATGPLFRDLDTTIPEGKVLEDYAEKELNTGKLAPDKETVNYFRAKLEERIQNKLYLPEKQILVLDGIPRTPEQVPIINEFIDITNVFYFKAEATTLLDRIMKRQEEQNRADDVMDVFLNRVYRFEKETKPLLKQFDENKILEIDAEMDQYKIKSILEEKLGIYEPALD